MVQLQDSWQANVVALFKLAGKSAPQLVLLPSPYRFVILPLVDYILELERDHLDRQIAVLVPELIVRHWWQTPLYNQRSQMLKLLLLVQGSQRTVVINIP